MTTRVALKKNALTVRIRVVHIPAWNSIADSSEKKSYNNNNADKKKRQTSQKRKKPVSNEESEKKSTSDIQSIPFV